MDIKLNKDQLRIFNKIKKDLSTTAMPILLQGPGGTGKTFLIGNIIQDLDSNTEITVTTTSNKALNILKNDKIFRTMKNVKFATIFQLYMGTIEYDDKGNERYIESKKMNEKYNCDIMIVDEVSMIKNNTYEKLHCQCNKIIYIGDRCQLPPVNDELRECKVFTCTDCIKYELKKNERSKNNNELIKINKVIRNILTDTTKYIDELDYTQLYEIVQCALYDKIFTPYDKLLHNKKDISNIARKLYKDKEEFILLTWTNKRKEEWLRIIKDKDKITGISMFENEDLGIFNKTIYVKNQLIYNSTYFRIKKIDTVREKINFGNYEKTIECQKMCVDVDELELIFYEILKKDKITIMNDFKTFKKNILKKYNKTQKEERDNELKKYWSLYYTYFPPIELFCLSTIHKAQGSTINTVIVDLDDLTKKLQGNNEDKYNIEEFLKLFYVAVSRAGHNLYIIK